MSFVAGEQTEIIETKIDPNEVFFVCSSIQTKRRSKKNESLFPLKNYCMCRVE
jgi:hypothetical protein